MPRKSPSSLLDHILDRVADAATEMVDNMIDDLERDLPRLIQSGVDRAQAQRPPKRAEKGPRKPQKPPKTTPLWQSDRTIYDDLEVGPRASPETIQAAYRSLAVRFHPDKGKDGERMKVINHAYGILSDAEKRKAYDKSIGL